MEVDIAIVGGGIAGAGLAAAIAGRARVALIEREHGFGYHATGRSAALFTETYGNSVIRGLTRTSRSFLSQPPEDFAAVPLLSQRGAVQFALDKDDGSAAALAKEWRAEVPSVRAIDAAEACELLPFMRPERLAAAVFEPGAADIDVDALLQGYLRVARRAGVTAEAGRELVTAERDGPVWRLALRSGETLTASVLVDAAGAWADAVAVLAGVRALGVQPLRRTAVLVDPPAGAQVSGWPMALDLGGGFYLKPDAGLVLASLNDETPSAPCDAQPEGIDVAVLADRLEKATLLPLTRIRRRWAGLRSFFADRTLAIGFDPEMSGFFWLAGQGGYGVQTSPAASHAAATLILGDPWPKSLSEAGVAASDLAPGRLRA